MLIDFQSIYFVEGVGVFHNWKTLINVAKEVSKSKECSVSCIDDRTIMKFVYN